MYFTRLAPESGKEHRKEIQENTISIIFYIYPNRKISDGRQSRCNKKEKPPFYEGGFQTPSGMIEIKFFMEKPLLFCAIVGIISVDRVQAKPLFCRQWRKQADAGQS